MIRIEKMAITDPQSWIAGFLVSIPVLGSIWAARVNTHNRIAKAEANGTEAKVECDVIRTEIAEVQLDITRKHATNKFVMEVEQRLTKRLETFETNLMTAIRDGRK